MSHDRKKQLRDTKRELKKAGNRRRRRELKRDLAENPDDPMTEYDLDRFKTDGLNGFDRDSTRRGHGRKGANGSRTKQEHTSDPFANPDEKDKIARYKPENDNELRADKSPP